MDGVKQFVKGGRVKSLAVEDWDMERINAIALEPLEKSQVYTFEVVACDNEIDRDYERFDADALVQMASLFEGKTVIKDHNAKFENQFARVYSATVVDGGGETSDGIPLKQLVVRCYTLNNDKNRDIIDEIKAGIKKEVSVSFSPGKVICSACGCNRREERCGHWWGEEYDGKTCYFTLTDIKDAYELSFVAIPAQRNAGTKKDYLIEDAERKNRAEQTEERHDEQSEKSSALDMEIELEMRRLELDS